MAHFVTDAAVSEEGVMLRHDALNTPFSAIIQHIATKSGRMTLKTTA